MSVSFRDHFEDRRMHRNGVAIVKVFKNVLWTALRTSFRPTRLQAFHTQSQNFSGVIPRTLAEAPPVLRPRHRFPLGSPCSVHIVPVLRNDHSFLSKMSKCALPLFSLRCGSRQLRRLHGARGERAPTFTNVWTRGTESRRTTNKKLTKLYWPLQKRSPKWLIVLLEPKRGGARQKNFSGASLRIGVPHFQIRSSATGSRCSRACVESSLNAPTEKPNCFSTLSLLNPALLQVFVCLCCDRWYGVVLTT